MFHFIRFSLLIKMFSSVAGTRAYTPPEFFLKGFYDGCQGTVWQLGIILVEMLSPVFPFRLPEEAVVMAPRVPQDISSGIG